MAATVHRQCGQAALHAARAAPQRAGGQDARQTELPRSDRQVLGAAGLLAEDSNGRAQGAGPVLAAPARARRGRHGAGDARAQVVEHLLAHELPVRQECRHDTEGPLRAHLAPVRHVRNGRAR